MPILLTKFFISMTLISAWVAHAEIDAKKIDQILGASKASSHSIVFIRLSDGHILYEKNAEQALCPASVTKVLTGIVALKKFGPATTSKTSFLYSGKKIAGKIGGDLFAVGRGDPLIISEKMWQLAADLKNAGISEIAGNIVIDNSYFDGEARDESRLEGENVSTHAYDAPVSAFAINFNTIAINISPGFKTKTPALVAVDPFPILGVKLVNRASTGSGTNISVTRNGSDKQNATLIVSGSIAASSQGKKVYRSISNHVQISGEYLRAFLKNAGIHVRGKVMAGKAPTSANILYELEGYDMRRVVSGLNTFSNNFIADMLTKSLGAEFVNAPGTFEKGVKVISDFMKQEMKISTPFTLKNGSGLDTANRASAKQIVQALQYAERSGDIFPDFYASLPAYGWDGTVKKRGERTSHLDGIVRAKTGTLTDPITVAAVSGYFRHPKEGLVAFAFISNGLEGKGQPGLLDLREKQDSVLESFFN